MTGDRVDWVWRRINWPRPLDAELAVELATRLAADPLAPPLVFELRAEHTGLRYLLGVPPEHVRRVSALARLQVPGVEISTDPEPRSAVQVARQVRLHPPGLGLDLSDRIGVVRAVLAALAVPLGQGDVLVLQIVVGPRHAPSEVPAKVPDPAAPWWRALLDGTPPPASKETRTLVRERAAHAGFSAAIRLGAAGSTPGRRQALTLGVVGALATARSPGLRLRLAPAPARRLNHATVPGWSWPVRLSAPELAAVLAWPVGDGEFAGLPALHPRRIRPAATVSSGERVFATSGAPGDDRKIGITAGDALRHLFALGPTGSGKSTALLHLITADIADGRPVVVIDPKRQLVDDILARIPNSRRDDVVVLDAADAPPVGFNPLAPSGRDPDVVVDGLLAVFRAVFRDGWGPRTQDIFHAGLLTLARTSRPGAAHTLVDLPRLLTDDAFRRLLVGQVMRDPVLGGFWAAYDDLKPGARAAVIAAPMNKLRQFLLRPALRAVLGQTDPAFHVRDVFRTRKVLLAPLNEGLLGPETAALLGSLLVAELWQATLERGAEADPTDRPGMVYIDEVQQYTHLPTSLSDALAQSRSLGVAWHLACQYRTQLPPDIRAAVDTNARSTLAFALGADDARDMARQTAGDLDAVDFQSLGVYEAYVNPVVAGLPSGWASITTLPPPPTSSDPEQIRAASRQRYGRTPDPTGTPEPPTRPRTSSSDQSTPERTPGVSGRPSGRSGGNAGRIGRRRRST